MQKSGNELSVLGHMFHSPELFSSSSEQSGPLGAAELPGLSGKARFVKLHFTKEPRMHLIFVLLFPGDGVCLRSSGLWDGLVDQGIVRTQIIRVSQMEKWN